jgi:hypothetical protein
MCARVCWRCEFEKRQLGGAARLRVRSPWCSRVGRVRVEPPAAIRKRVIPRCLAGSYAPGPGSGPSSSTCAPEEARQAGARLQICVYDSCPHSLALMFQPWGRRGRGKHCPNTRWAAFAVPRLSCLRLPCNAILHVPPAEAHMHPSCCCRCESRLRFGVSNVPVLVRVERPLRRLLMLFPLPSWSGRNQPTPPPSGLAGSPQGSGSVHC